MDENPNGMINPLTPKPENVEPIQPMSEENLVQSTPVEPVVSEPPVMPAESVASVEPIAPTQPAVESFTTTQPVAPQPIMQQSANPVEPMGTTAPVPPKKKNTSLIISIILGVVAIGCAVAAILMFTVFKPSDNSGSSENSGSSDNTGGNTENTSKYADAPDTIDSCPGCVYSLETNLSYNNGSGDYPQEKLTEDQYSSNWKSILADNDELMFFGYIFDDGGNINKAYACGIVKEMPFCLEGNLGDEYGGDSSIRSEAYNRNYSTLQKVYGSNNCEEYSSIVECRIISGNNVTAEIEKEQTTDSYDGRISINKDAGKVSVSSGGGGSYVTPDGDAYCVGTGCYWVKQKESQ